jgi:hypothetical protein
MATNFAWFNRRDATRCQIWRSLMESSFRHGCQSRDTIRAVAEGYFVEVRHACGLTNHYS